MKAAKDPFLILLEGVQLLQGQIESLSRRVDVIQKALLDPARSRSIQRVRLTDALAKLHEEEKRLDGLRKHWQKSIKGRPH